MELTRDCPVQRVAVAFPVMVPAQTASGLSIAGSRPEQQMQLGVQQFAHNHHQFSAVEGFDQWYDFYCIYCLQYARLAEWQELLGEVPSA